MAEQTPGTVKLSQKLKIDGKDVDQISVRKPKSGELRGLKLTDVVQMDVSAMMNLLPRITQPPLSPQQISDLDPADLLALSSEAVVFFAPADQRAALTS